MKAMKLFNLLGLLAVILLGSCSEDEEKTKPVAGFTASKTTVTVGETIQFTNTSTDALSYNWSFGDGTTSTETSPSKIYENAGTFTVTLVANGDGGTDSENQTITVEEEVIPKPTASFTSDKSSAIVGETIQFTNTSTLADSYLWRFGDETTSTEVSPSKIYENGGEFTVTLIATNEGGQDSTSSVITINVVPTASFTADKTSVLVGELVTFTNTSENATSYAWDFGDETTSTEVSPTKTYAAAGQFTVTLTATSENGSDTETLVITVTAANVSSIYFIDSSDELIQKLSLDGSGTVSLIKNVAEMSGVGIVYDETNDKIYFSDFYDADTPDGKIWKMNTDGTGAEAIVTGILDPYGIALDETNGKIYWTDDAGNISRANTDGTNVQVGIVNVADGMMRAISLDVENNKMYFYEVNAENLYVANLDGTNASILIAGVYGYMLFVDTVNDKIYFDDQNTPGLRKANIDGTGVTAVDNTDTRIYGLDIDYEEGKIYWTSRDNGEIYKANLDGSGKEVLKSGLTSPRGMFFKK